ncbi:hypothetical protein CVT24_008135 [Panaeolus cyanescens]|uniref:Uncharacterized protein n=1 Tax=Panaeolus cyanescens TaxID=181874 RepID=A0A409W4G8_9AGAR|nr:hypothetical protein CVT24_008135 [Panaeolus cyanescens]
MHSLPQLVSLLLDFNPLRGSEPSCSPVNLHLPTLYPDIIDNILGIINEWPSCDRDQTLLHCALVCKVWCPIARRYSFAVIRGIATYEMAALRRIFRSTRRERNYSQHHFGDTIVQHVRTATFRVYMDSDEWSVVKEMLELPIAHRRTEASLLDSTSYLSPSTSSTLPNFSLHSHTNTHIKLAQGTLFGWHLFDLQSYIRSNTFNLTHLDLSHLKLAVTKSELKSFLFVARHRGLKSLSWNSVGWWVEEESLHVHSTDVDGSSDSSADGSSTSSPELLSGPGGEASFLSNQETHVILPCRSDPPSLSTFTIDRLHYYTEACEGEETTFTEKFWPHRLLNSSILDVRELIIRVDSWVLAFEMDIAREMVLSLASNLVELDLAHEALDYDCHFFRKISKVSFPSLKTLKFQIGNQEYSLEDDGDTLQDTSQLFLEALSQLTSPENAPSLEHVVIFLTEGIMYLAALNTMSTYPFEHEDYFLLQTGYEWNILDDAIWIASWLNGIEGGRTGADISVDRASSSTLAQTGASSARVVSANASALARPSPKVTLASEPFFLDYYAEFDIDEIVRFIKSRCPKSVGYGADIRLSIQDRQIETSRF